MSNFSKCSWSASPNRWKNGWVWVYEVSEGAHLFDFSPFSPSSLNRKLKRRGERGGGEFQWGTFKGGWLQNHWGETHFLATFPCSEQEGNSIFNSDFIRASTCAPHGAPNKRSRGSKMRYQESKRAQQKPRCPSLESDPRPRWPWTDGPNVFLPNLWVLIAGKNGRKIMRE